MSRLSKEFLASESVISYPTSYDSTKWYLPSAWKQNISDTPNYIGVEPISTFRPVETGAAFGGYCHTGVLWSSRYDWIFLADNAAAATTRRIHLYIRDKSIISGMNWQGFITLTMPFRTAAPNFTIRGCKAAYDNYTTGTVEVSGTSVTGAGTAWQTSRLASGSRIGFGSTDPSLITQWYEISSIGSDNTITLTGSAGTIAPGTAYVIEELRIILTVTGSTAANGSGLYIAKGLRPELFTVGGTTISTATNTDNIRAVYWCSDGVAQTNTVPSGLAIVTKDSWTQQYAYATDNTTNVKITKYNLRAALTPASGVDSGNAFVLATNAVAVTGTAQTINCCFVATLGHGAASGVRALYFATTTRVYCCLDTSITAGSVTWQDYAMTEVPPGGVSTFAVTAAMNRVDYDSTIDRIVIITSNASSFRNYITQFRTDGSQFDHIVMGNNKQIDQGGASVDIPSYHALLEQSQDILIIGPTYYWIGIGNTAVTNIGHVVPMGADWSYTSTTGQRLISPKFSLTNVSKILRVNVLTKNFLGSNGLELSLEPIRILYRTSGIDDNLGVWTSIPSIDGDISSLGSVSEIQFAIEQKMFGLTCIPNRVFRISVEYEDNTTDSHFQFSAGLSDKTTKSFAFRFSTAFGSTVPRLKLTLLNAITGGNLGEDDSTTQSWTWEKTTDGGSSWLAWNNTDKGNDITYYRITNSSLADNIMVIPLLRQY